MVTTPERWRELADESERLSVEAQELGDVQRAERLLRRSAGQRRMADVETRLQSLGLADPMNSATLASATLLRGLDPDQSTKIIDEVERLRMQLDVPSNDPVALHLYEGAGHALMGADYTDYGAMLLAQAANERELDVRPLARLARLDDDALAEAAGRIAGQP